MCIDIFYPLILFNFNQPTKHNVLLVPFFFVLYLPAFFSSTQTKYNTTHTNFHCLCTSEWTKDACTCAFIFCSMCLSMLTLGLPHKYWNWHVTASSPLSLTLAELKLIWIHRRVREDVWSCGVYPAVKGSHIENHEHTIIITSYTKRKSLPWFGRLIVDMFH